MPVIVNNKEEWETVDILDARYFDKSWRLEYRVKWRNEKQLNRHWYFAINSKLKNVEDLLDNLYTSYPNKSGTPGHR